jgi:UDP-perosamine 4-acetyltransferase
MSNAGLVIVGASGHGRVAYQIATAMGRTVLGFVDAGKDAGDAVFDVAVLACEPEECAQLCDGSADWFVAIGSNRVRREMFGRIGAQTQRAAVNLIHPSAIMAPGTVMGSGIFVGPGAIVNIASSLGDGVILNTGASLDHDGVLEDFAQVCPGCALSGATTVGEGGFLGTGASTIPCINIGAGSVVGAGGVVIRDVPDGVTVVGVPAKPI